MTSRPEANTEPVEPKEKLGKLCLGCQRQEPPTTSLVSFGTHLWQLKQGMLVRIRKIKANPVILPLLSQGNSYSPAPLDLSNVVLSRELQVSADAFRTALLAF